MSRDVRRRAGGAAVSIDAGDFFREREAVVLDIETVPIAASLAVPYPAADRDPPASYKSDESIQRWREADAVKWAQTPDPVEDVEVKEPSLIILPGAQL